MRVLVTVASKHGATADNGRLITDGLIDAGIDAVSVPPDLVASVDEYEAVVIGSAVYLGRWMAPAADLIRRHADVLATKRVWLFSSGPVGDPPSPEGDPLEIPELMALSGAKAHHIFAGRLVRHGLGPGERLVVTVVGAPDGDFRSPAEIGEWTARLARDLGADATD